MLIKQMNQPNSLQTIHVTMRKHLELDFFMIVINNYYLIELVDQPFQNSKLDSCEDSLGYFINKIFDTYANSEAFLWNKYSEKHRVIKIKSDATTINFNITEAEKEIIIQ